MPRGSSVKDKGKKPSAEVKSYEYIPTPDTKDLAVDKLRELGFNAKNESGVVMVYCKVTEKYTDVLKQLQEAIRSIGYDASYGIRASI